MISENARFQSCLLHGDQAVSTPSKKWRTENGLVTFEVNLMPIASSKRCSLSPSVSLKGKCAILQKERR